MAIGYAINQWTIIPLPSVSTWRKTYNGDPNLHKIFQEIREGGNPERESIIRARISGISHPGPHNVRRQLPLKAGKEKCATHVTTLEKDSTMSTFPSSFVRLPLIYLLWGYGHGKRSYSGWYSGSVGKESQIK